MSERKKLAVWKFASCDGCQLSILDMEDHLLEIAENIEIAYFPEASSNYQDGPYDLSLVEGSITSPEEMTRIKEIRSQSKLLITIGACATTGGIQALKNYKDVNDFISMVYAHPEYISTLETSTGIAEHVKVDFQLRGCPVSKEQLLDLIGSYLSGKKPNVANESVCIECKRNSTVCLLVSGGKSCLGPVTHAGCDALCPRYRRACFGCYGAKNRANPEALSEKFQELGDSPEEIKRNFRGINCADKVFKEESLKYESTKD